MIVEDYVKFLEGELEDQMLYTRKIVNMLNVYEGKYGELTEEEYRRCREYKTVER